MAIASETIENVLAPPLDFTLFAESTGMELLAVASLIDQTQVSQYGQL